MSREAERMKLVEQLAARGICDARVLQAIAEIPREQFVPAESLESAYDDHALPIGGGQTISQPYMVALMTQELSLHGTEKVLEVGTGSGYQTAVLSKLCRHIVTIERISELSARARNTLACLEISNVEFHIGDGSLGWAAEAPYDRILVTAGSPEIPPELLRQLGPAGRLVIPVGRQSPVKLQTIVNDPVQGRLVIDVCDCSFVPLLGAAGWHEPLEGGTDH